MRYRATRCGMVALALWASLACNSSAVAPHDPPPAVVNAASTAAPTPRDGGRRAPRAPLRLEVSGPGSVNAGEQITIAVTAIRERPGGGPAKLSLVVPKGTRVVSGLPPPELGTADVERFEVTLAIDAVPTEPFEVVAESQTRRSGVRAHGSYRFGRAAPELPRPERSGRPVEIGRGVRVMAVPLGARER
jgi:hypothetical protein